MEDYNNLPASSTAWGHYAEQMVRNLKQTSSVFNQKPHTKAQVEELRSYRGRTQQNLNKQNNPEKGDKNRVGIMPRGVSLMPRQVK